MSLTVQRQSGGYSSELESEKKVTSKPNAVNMKLFLSLGFGNILKFSSKQHKTSKNRDTLIILKTHFVPKITQKAKNKTLSVVYLIAVWEVKNIAAPKCTFISPNASSTL